MPFVKNCCIALEAFIRAGEEGEREWSALKVLLEGACSCNVDLKCQSLINNLWDLLLSVLVRTPVSNGCGDGGP